MDKINETELKTVDISDRKDLMETAGEPDIQKDLSQDPESHLKIEIISPWKSVKPIYDKVNG